MNGYNKSIDGLRGIAILLIIMFHCHVCYFGWSGVVLFFVLSGYLITKVILIEKEKTSNLKIKFRNFWARRVLRIFPLYYLYLFILAILLLVNAVSPLITSELSWLFSYTYNFFLINVYETKEPTFLAGHLWSLSIEEQFYVLYPVMIFTFNRKYIRVSVIVLILVSVLFRVYYSLHQTTNSNGYLDYSPVSYLDSFLFGATIHIFNLERISPSKGFRVFLVSALIVLGSGFFMYLDVYKNQPFSINNYLSSFGIEPHYTKNYYRVWGLIELNLFFAALLLVILLKGKNWMIEWMRRIFEAKPLVSIGKVSYGMYVFHAIVIWALLKVFGENHMNKYLFFLICLTGTWIVSFAAYHLYEKKFLALKEKFR